MSEDKAASFFEEVFDSLRGSRSAKLKAGPLYAQLLLLVPASSVKRGCCFALRLHALLM